MDYAFGFIEPSPKKREMMTRAASLADAMLENLNDCMAEMAAEEPQEVKDMAYAVLAQTLLLRQAVKDKPEKLH